MSKEVRNFEEALRVLKALHVEWLTMNEIQNSLFETGVAFFNRSYCRVAYYDEVQHVLSIN